MQKLLLFFGFTILIFPKEIISEFEYGQMLYNNPRGVSCMRCHGPKGEGQVIISYLDKKTKVTLSAPNIINKSLKDYKRATQTGPKVMPKYFLTQKELIAIYRYIQRANKKIEVKDENSSNSDDFNIPNSSQNTDSNQTASSSSITKLEEPTSNPL